jgi:hypothetical protein
VFSSAVVTLLAGCVTVVASPVLSLRVPLVVCNETADDIATCDVYTDRVTVQQQDATITPQEQLRVFTERVLNGSLHFMYCGMYVLLILIFVLFFP